MVLRPYGRTAVFRAGRRARRNRPSSALPARFARDRGRLRPRRKRRVNPRSYFDADPGQSGPLSHRRSPVGDSVPHGAAVEIGCTALIFMRRFWQQFTHGGNFKAVSGFQPRIIFARSQNWQLWAKNVAASDNRGVSARSQRRNYFETRHLLKQMACPLEAEKS